MSPTTHQKALPLQKFSRVAVILDKLANREGIDAKHVAQRVDLLEEMGMEPDDIDDEVVIEAQKLHREIMYGLHNRVSRLNGYA